VIRLSDRVFAGLSRVYFAQKRLRDAEAREALEREDAAQRAYYDALREAHAIGLCGGAPRCPYVPCVKPVDGRPIDVSTWAEDEVNP
jgi:hypothetical protein